MPSADLIKAIAVTAELCGRTFSPEAAAVFVEDLAGFDEQQVMGALRRCRREVRGLLTTQDVVSRIDDGRPGPDEAWAMLPRDEATSVVWTTEMADACSVAKPLLSAGDRAGAAKAFREAYVARVNAARDERRPPEWQVSLGHDIRGREEALQIAVQRNRLTLSQAQSYGLPLQIQASAGDVLQLASTAVRHLAGNGLAKAGG